MAAAAGVRRHVDVGENRGSRLNPVNAAVAVLRRYDRRNDRRRGDERRFVQLVARAVKPGP